LILSLLPVVVIFQKTAKKSTNSAFNCTIFSTYRYCCVPQQIFIFQRREQPSFAAPSGDDFFCSRSGSKQGFSKTQPHTMSGRCKESVYRNDQPEALCDGVRRKRQTPSATRIAAPGLNPAV
jgi:hypothetical protein